MNDPLEIYEDDSWVVRAKEGVEMENEGKFQGVQKGQKISSGLSRAEGGARKELEEDKFSPQDHNLGEKNLINSKNRLTNKNGTSGFKQSRKGLESYQNLLEAEGPSSIRQNLNNGQSSLRQHIERNRPIQEPGLSRKSSKKTKKQGQSTIMNSTRLKMDRSPKSITKTKIQQNEEEELEKKRKAKMEELRFEFDCLEFMDVSKKSNILNQTFLKGYHRVLLPHVLYTLQKEQKTVGIKESAKGKSGSKKGLQGAKRVRFSDMGAGLGGGRSASENRQRGGRGVDGGGGSVSQKERAGKKMPSAIGLVLTQVLLKRLGEDQIKKREQQKTSFLRGILSLGRPKNKKIDKNTKNQPPKKIEEEKEEGEEDGPEGSQIFQKAKKGNNPFLRLFNSPRKNAKSAKNNNNDSGANGSKNDSNHNKNQPISLSSLAGNSKGRKKINMARLGRKRGGPGSKRKLGFKNSFRKLGRSSRRNLDSEGPEEENRSKSRPVLGKIEEERLELKEKKAARISTTKSQLPASNQLGGSEIKFSQSRVPGLKKKFRR